MCNYRQKKPLESTMIVQPMQIDPTCTWSGLSSSQIMLYRLDIVTYIYKPVNLSLQDRFGKAEIYHKTKHPSLN